MDTVQSLERGLKIMELLAEEKVMTATGIGARLGLHQSSASRLLNSLVQAGFVRKPDYRSFALDYGSLVFAGRAMDCFPAIGRAAAVCNSITLEYGFSATVAMLKGGHLLYLTRSKDDASLVLVNNSDWPLIESIPGLILACEQPEEKALTLLAEKDAPSPSSRAIDIYHMVKKKSDESGFLFMENFRSNRFNGGLPFTLDEERAALAVFSSHLDPLPPILMKEILQRGVDRILGLAD
jgi:DNA-binding IclR family transcriptional regulator